MPRFSRPSTSRLLGVLLLGVLPQTGTELKETYAESCGATSKSSKIQVESLRAWDLRFGCLAFASQAGGAQPGLRNELTQALPLCQNPGRGLREPIYRTLCDGAADPPPAPQLAIRVRMKKTSYWCMRRMQGRLVNLLFFLQAWFTLPSLQPKLRYRGVVPDLCGKYLPSRRSQPGGNAFQPDLLVCP